MNPYTMEQSVALEGLADDFRAVWQFIHQAVDADDAINEKSAAVRILWMLSDRVETTLVKHFPDRVKDGAIPL